MIIVQQLYSLHEQHAILCHDAIEQRSFPVALQTPIHVCQQALHQACEKATP